MPGTRFVFAMAVAICAWCAVPGRAQEPEPDFRLLVLGYFDTETLAVFAKRTQDYAALRARLEKGLPPLVVTTNADEIESFERRLAHRIRHARRSRRYQVFVPNMERQIKHLLKTRATPATIAAIMDDGPGDPDVDINDTYSKQLSLATMPPSILLALPDLPPDMEYRFVGRNLVLLDVRANMVIDEIPGAIDCDGCVVEPEEEPNKP